MMGSKEDPQDGAKVAAAVFGAVVVYAVCKALRSKKTAFESVVLK